MALSAASTRPPGKTNFPGRNTWRACRLPSRTLGSVPVRSTMMSVAASLGSMPAWNPTRSPSTRWRGTVVMIVLLRPKIGLDDLRHFAYSLGSAVSNDLAGAEHDDAVGQICYQLHVVLDPEDTEAQFVPDSQ